MRIISDGTEARRLTAPVRAVLSTEGSPRPVASLFPRSFPAHAKIFHSMFEDPTFAADETTWDDAEGQDDEQLWRDVTGVEPPGVLMRSGTGSLDLDASRRILWRELVGPELLDARADWRTLATAFDDPSWPRRIVGPDEGSLDPVSLRALIGHLEDRSPDDSCVMFVQEWAALATIPARYEEDLVPECGLVARGEVRDVRRFVERYGVTPEVWWAVGGGWIVFTDHDSCATFVAGSEELVGAIEADPGLESIRVDGSDIAFPDRRAVPLAAEVIWATKLEFYRGFLWWLGCMAVIFVTMMFGGVGGGYAIVWGSAAIYGTYRLTRGLYTSGREMGEKWGRER